MHEPASGDDLPPRAPLLARLGPLAYLGGLFLGGLLLLALARALLTAGLLARVRLEPRYWLVFPLGLRIDVVVMSYVLAPAALLLLTLPAGLLRRVRPLLALHAAVLLALVALMEAVSPDFIDQYDVRPNRLFFEGLGGSREILATVWKQYGLHLVLVIALTAGVLTTVYFLARRALRLADGWSLGRRLASLPLVLALLFLGVRGTLAHRPINAAMVAFSGQNVVNQLALNSTYTAARAWYDLRHERPPADLYGRMPKDEILARVGRYVTTAPADERAGVPFLHAQHPRERLARPRNLVIVLEESLGAEFVGALGGKPLTPQLDALAQEGLWFTRLYSTGTRTVRGIEAVVSGFLPTPGDSVVKLSRSQSNFFTVAGLLKAQGYATDFVYGGESHFDNMAAFFLANGFERAFNQSDYENPAFHGTWGVSDEDLMRKANETFRAHGEQPFFALVLTTTNHSPYEFPDGRIELHDQKKATRNNTVKYADFALGELFRLARTEAYWRDTVWLVVADHDERTYGDQLIPVDKFHIPGLILAPGLAPAKFERVASQIDLVPTALDLLGLELVHPMIGRNLFTLPPDDPGRAILQFHDTHGFLVGERLAVHPGGATPRCFTVRNGELVPAPDDAEFLRDARAHALLPGLLYEEGLYPAPPMP